MRLAVTALKIAVSVTLLWLLFRNIALASLIADLKRLRAGPVALVMALGFAQIFLLAARWHRVGGICGAPLSWNANLRLIFIGQFFNQTLPSSIGGDALRVWLSVRTGVPPGRAFSSVAVDRLVSFIVLAGLSLVTLPLFYRLVSDNVLRHALAALLAAYAAAFLFLLTGGAKLAPWLRSWRVTAPFGAITADLRRLFLQPGGVVIAALSLVIHLMSVAMVLLIAAGLGVGLSPGAALVLVPPILLILVIPIAIAGWGLRESAMVVALAQVHISAPDALAISILFGLMQIVVSLPGALLWLQRPERPQPIHGL